MAAEQGHTVDPLQEIGCVTRDNEAELWKKKAEHIFEGLPPSSIPKLPAQHAFNLSRYKNRPDFTPIESWQTCAKAMEKYDADTCRAHREEIDTLLVFAGLFSAVVTAFTVESYQWLRDDPDATIIALLSEIARPAQGVHSLPAPTGPSGAVSARINAYWFLALVLSLSAALVAILCKQWVREFERHADQAHEQFIGIRQMKLEGFEGWGVSSIIAAIPLLLLSALGLFALGLIEFLWHLHCTVAIIVLIPAMAAVIFYFTTTALPGLQVITGTSQYDRERRSQCPFKSPQAMLTLRTVVALGPYLRSSSTTCSSALGTIVIFSHRKCLVFFRRILSYWKPVPLSDSQSRSQDAQHGTVPAATRMTQMCISSCNWLLGPWKHEERVFYNRFTDRPTWGGLRQCWLNIWLVLSFRRSAKGCQQQGTSMPIFIHPSSAQSFSPRAQHLKSWITLDREFNSFRDSIYTLGEYKKAVESRANNLPPTSCFRGLAWLREHIDQPGMLHRIWSAVWDMATNLEKRRMRYPVEVFLLQHGILHLMSGQGGDKMARSSKPSAVAMALRYALHVDLNPSLVAEAFVHLLSALDAEVGCDILNWLTEKLGKDDPCRKAVLHAILAHSLTFPSGGQGPTVDVRPLLRIVAGGMGSHPWSLSQQELACMVAVHFRELLSRGSSTFQSRWDLQVLCLVALDRLAADAGRESSDHATRPRKVKGVTPIFAHLALALDRCFEQLVNEESWDRRFAAELIREQNRRIYFKLLAGELDDPGALAEAEDRFQRIIVPLARRRGELLARLLEDLSHRVNRPQRSAQSSLAYEPAGRENVQSDSSLRPQVCLPERQSG